jgi:hypothetical protein
MDDSHPCCAGVAVGVKSDPDLIRHQKGRQARDTHHEYTPRLATSQFITSLTTRVFVLQIKLMDAKKGEE